MPLAMNARYLRDDREQLVAKALRHLADNAAAVPQAERDDARAMADALDDAMWLCDTAEPRPSGADQAGPRFLIWSNEHMAWWRPGSAGYTAHAEAAGRYTHEQALSISANARGGWRPGSPPPEIPVAEADVLACEARYAEMTGRAR